MKIVGHDKSYEDEEREDIKYWEYIELKVNHVEATSIICLLSSLQKLKFDKDCQWRVTGKNDKPEKRLLELCRHVN